MAAACMHNHVCADAHTESFGVRTTGRVVRRVSKHAGVRTVVLLAFHDHHNDQPNHDCVHAYMRRYVCPHCTDEQ